MGGSVAAVQVGPGLAPFWSALAGAIAASIGAQTLLKAGVAAGSFLRQLFDWHTLGGLMLYGLAALLYILALRRIPISVALPCTAMSYVVIAAIGHYVYGEAIGPAHLAGLGLIVGGVLLLAFR